jgi:hypothetical protein
MKELVGIWTDGWVWGSKSSLWIAYSNQKSKDSSLNMTSSKAL